MTLISLPKNSFQLPAPIAPKLVALGLDGKTATIVSRVYLSVAHTLKETCETNFIHASNALIATRDDRGYCSKKLRSKLLTVIIARYTQTLSKWTEEATQRAEASLLRGKKNGSPQTKVSSLPH